MQPNDGTQEKDLTKPSQTSSPQEEPIGNSTTMPDSAVITPTQSPFPNTAPITSNLAVEEQPAQIAPQNTDQLQAPSSETLSNSPVTTPTIVPTPVASQPTAEAATQSQAIAPSTAQPYAVNQTPVIPVIGSVGQSATSNKPTSNKKRWLVAGGIAVVVAALAGGAVFGLYLPNTPSNVWSNSLDRSGKALNSLVTSASSKETLQSFGASNVSGTVSATFEDSKYEGDFTTKFDKSNLDGGINVNLTQDGEASKKLSLKVLSSLPKDTVYPDVYFQVSGIKALGLDQMLPQLTQYDGKWIYASSSYLKSVGADFVKTSDNTKSQVTSDDVASAVQAATKTTQEYVFTKDTDKAVLEQKEFIGKETVDGVKAYHYKATVNNAHAEAYCLAMNNTVFSTELYKKISGQSADEIAQSKKDATTNCKDSTKNLAGDTGTLDVWMDSKYKIIYKIRAYDKDNKQAYTDIGQHYKGGDDIALFVNYHNPTDKIDGSLTMNTNMKTHNSNAMFMINDTSTDNPYSVKVTLQAQPLSTPVTITKPSPVSSIEDVLKALGITDTSSGVSQPLSDDAYPVSSSAADVERQTDIQSLDSHIEAYFAINGFYPTLSNMNDTTWRSKNLQGTDPEVFKDPSGTTNQLASAATSTQYGYKPADCDASGADCQSFTLSALLSTGKLFTKQSF